MCSKNYVAPWGTQKKEDRLFCKGLSGLAQEMRYTHSETGSQGLASLQTWASCSLPHQACFLLCKTEGRMVQTSGDYCGQGCINDVEHLVQLGSK